MDGDEVYMEGEYGHDPLFVVKYDEETGKWGTYRREAVGDLGVVSRRMCGPLYGAGIQPLAAFWREA